MLSVMANTQGDSYCHVYDGLVTSFLWENIFMFEWILKILNEWKLPLFSVLIILFQQLFMPIRERSCRLYSCKGKCKSCLSADLGLLGGWCSGWFAVGSIRWYEKYDSSQNDWPYSELASFVFFLHLIINLLN